MAMASAASSGGYVAVLRMKLEGFGRQPASQCDLSVASRPVAGDEGARKREDEQQWRRRLNQPVFSAPDPQFLADDPVLWGS
jgi:hypothetical protein